MSRAAFAVQLRQEQEESLTKQDSPQQDAFETDEAQDRRGASGAFGTGWANAPDPWTEIATLISRMLRGTPGPTGGTSSQFAPGTGQETPVDTAATDTVSDVVKSVDATPTVSTGAEASTLPATTLALATGGGKPLEDSTIETPSFADAKEKEIEPTDGASGTGAAAVVAPASTDGAEGGGGGGGGGSPRAIVRRWQSGVGTAGGKVPRPRVAVPADEEAQLKSKAAAMQAHNEEVRADLAGEALTNVPPAPEVEDAPPPPAQDPVPEHSKAILDLSHRRLPDQVPPALENSPVQDVETVPIGGNPPRLDEEPVSPDLFNVLTTIKGLENAQLLGPDGQLVPEARKAREALEQLSRTGKPKEEEGRGEPVIAPDRGPRPMQPLPEELQVPVGQVVARLLANLDESTTGVLNSLRAQAYPGGALLQNFPEIGARLGEEVRLGLDTGLREIAAAANVSAKQLEGMIADRQNELAESSRQALQGATETGETAVKTAADEGQKSMDAVAGAARQAEEETLRRQEAASGSADPAVINRRRDLTVRWMRDHVTTQITHYQEAGDRRERELKEAQESQANAYVSLAQREQYQILTPKPPREERKAENATRENSLADAAAVFRVWGEKQVERIGKLFGAMLKNASALTRKNRGEIEAAGTAGIEAARRWAEDKVLEGQSWWDRFVARVKRWLGQADQLNEQWRVRRTGQMRNAVATDIHVIETARQKLMQGLSREEVLADKTLRESDRKILEQFFELPPDMHPLDFAAARLHAQFVDERKEQARAVFERELFETATDIDTVDKLNAVARSEGGDFDGAKIAEKLHAAMDQWGTDEGAIFAALAGLTPLRGMIVRKYYRLRFSEDLDKELDSEMSGDEYRRAMAQLQGQQARADAIALHDAIAGVGTDEESIKATLRNKTPAQIEAIRAEYLSRYGETLDHALDNDLEEGNERDEAGALLNCDTATADAIALDESMRGGFLGLGTSEADIEKVYERLRSEVLARAKAERWTSAQMRAEVRRRLKQIEARFGERYANVEQYVLAGQPGDSLLTRAFTSEMSDGQLDLAKGLQADDPVAIDAARLEIEDEGIYASDDKINTVFRSQYERSLEARRLDEGPARNMVVAREVDKWRREMPIVSEEEISRRRIKLEREMEKGIETNAAADAKLSMDQLGAVYAGKYGKSLDQFVEDNMSGVDKDMGRALSLQGGKLTPFQEIEFATDRVGTDEDMLRSTLSRMTKAEIAVLRAEWEDKHWPNKFDDMLRDELSGRDESDVMDMAKHGAPESALEQIDQERRRVKRELGDLTGVAGGVAGREEKWMKSQFAALEAKENDLKRVNWENTPQDRAKRAALAEEVDFRVQRVKDSVEDHRRRLDSVTDRVTQIVGIVVAVVVGALLTPFTGPGGPALGLVLLGKIAALSSAAATVSTMLTKQLILGGAYGDEDVFTDVAVGVVDAGSSFFAPGLTKALMKPMTVLAGKAGNVALQMSKSSVGQGLGKLPGVSAIKQVAGSHLPTREVIERGAATFVAEGMVDAVGALPPGLAQMALDDNMLRGDPLMNFLDGGGAVMLQGVLMGRTMDLGMKIGGAAVKNVRDRFPPTDALGKLAELNRLLGEGWFAYKEKNPAASVFDFAQSAQGKKLRAEIETKGLMSTIEGLGRQEQASSLAGKGGAAGGSQTIPHVAPEVRVSTLEKALPKKLREGTVVTPDPSLSGRTVRVEPLRVGKVIVGVDIRVGPDAGPVDIALHAATVNAMQRYRGVLGNIRRVLHDTRELLIGTRLTVGSRGWEAQLEIGKLPGVIAQRMDALVNTPMTPEAHAKAMADIASLERQVDLNHAVLQDPKWRERPGRGHVAAEDEGDGPPQPPKDLSLTDAQRKAMLDDPVLGPKLEELRRLYTEGMAANDLTAAHAFADALQTDTGIHRANLVDAAMLPVFLGPDLALSHAEGQSLEHERWKMSKERKREFGRRLQEARAAASQAERVALETAVLRDLAAELNLRGADLSAKIFDDMVEWLQADGSLSGRRPGAKDLVRFLRGEAKPEGLDLEGFVLGSVLQQNVAAVAALRKRLEAIAPDMTFGVERGGAFLIEALASPGGGALPPKFSAAQKGADGARTEDLGRQIRAAIDGGKRSFAIADFYMGGHAAGEFTGMFEKIIADYPHIHDLRFEMLWLRERHGYERNTVNAEGTALADGGLQPEFEIPPALAGKVFQTIEPVQLVLGDDMKMAFDPNSKRPITIFDNQGKVIRTIEVGTRHPKTGVPLSTPREILVALLQGNIFKISPQKQMSHVYDTWQWHEEGQKSYFLKVADARAVYSAFLSGEAEILGIKSNGDVVVRYEAVTGYNNNIGAGFLNQPTHVFFIKGNTSPSVVPTNPNWEE